MLCRVNAFKIADVVVGVITIPVVDMVPFRDRPVVLLPYLLVEGLYALLDPLTAGFVIPTMCGASRIRVPPESDPVEHHGLHPDGPLLGSLDMQWVTMSFIAGVVLVAVSLDVLPCVVASFHRT